MKTLFIRLMLEEGFLTNTTIYPSLAHTDEVLAQYAAALDIVFAKMADILKRGGIEAVREILGDNVCQTGFKRLLK